MCRLTESSTLVCRDEPEEIQSRAAEDGSGDIRMGIEGTRDNGVEARTPLRVRTTNIADHGG